MKQYSFVQAFVMSFYSRKLYRDIAQNWGANAILYLFLLLIVLCIPYTFATQHSINREFSNNPQNGLQLFMNQVPVITLNSNGTISTPEDRPYLIYVPHSREVIGVIDTSGKYTTLENQKFSVLITKNNIMDRKQNQSIEITKIPVGKSYVIQPQIVVTKAEAWSRYLWVLIFPFVLTGAFVGRLLQGLVLAVIGKVLSMMMNMDITYGTIYLVTLVALTPVMVLKTFITCMNYLMPTAVFDFPNAGLLYFLLAVLYVFFALYAIKTKPTE